MEPDSRPPWGTDFLTVQEVARWLRVCDQTVRRYIQSGDLYAWNVGQIYKIPHSSVLQFLDNQTHKRHKNDFT